MGITNTSWLSLQDLEYAMCGLCWLLGSVTLQVTPTLMVTLTLTPSLQLPGDDVL